MSYTLNKTGAQIDAILLRAEAGGAIDGAIALKAPLASPALTGTPTAPTAAAGTDTTQIATTAFVNDAVQAEAEADALRYAPAIVVPTSFAPVASFSDGADGVPLKSAMFQIVPAQSGSGTPAPDNVRPISGWTAANIYRSGKNLWTFGDHSGTFRYYFSAFYLKAGTYTFSAVATSSDTDGSTCRVQIVGVAGTTIETYQFARGTRASGTFTATTDGNYRVYIFAGQTSNQSQNDAFAFSDIQLELGSTATAYEAYNGTTYNIDWTDEAGTVYGGTLQYLGGGQWKLTVDFAPYPSDLGARFWEIISGNGPDYFQTNTIGSLNISRRAELICNKYKTQVPSSVNTDDFITGFTATGELRIRDSRYTTVDDFKASLSDVVIAYPRNTVQTYDLTGADVLTLLGANNIWSDTGDAAVEYRADTKLYIDGQIAALQALVLENNG